MPPLLVYVCAGLLLRQVLACVHGSMTAASGSRDGLAIDGVGNVAAGKHARNVGLGCGVLDDDIALGIAFECGAEYIAVGMMADGKEQTVDGQVGAG